MALSGLFEGALLTSAIGVPIQPIAVKRTPRNGSTDAILWVHGLDRRRPSMRSVSHPYPPDRKLSSTRSMRGEKTGFADRGKVIQKEFRT